MERKMEAREAVGCFERLIEDLNTEGDVAIVERDGAPLATIMPYSLYEALRDAGFDSISAGAERAAMSDDEAMELALRVIAEIRAEQHQGA